uniref:ribosomal protein S7 n=1 Tax=Mitrastemon yamamotoi TaxID=51498 RepID=UPI0026E3A428|nr:ribosomal protein S7 [Mitrastemon yamamotoi]USS58004.1 ribosomal protein S7 [Mitrastemon yamamotoi]
MSRHRLLKNKIIKPDPIYYNKSINILINHIMKNGKKSLAYYIIYNTLNNICKKKKKPLFILNKAINKVTPKLSVQTKHKCGSIFKIPIEIKSTKGKILAIRWLLTASKKRFGKNMSLKFSSELIDAAKGKGEAIRKKELIHKIAESSRTLANFK